MANRVHDFDGELEREAGSVHWDSAPDFPIRRPGWQVLQQLSAGPLRRLPPRCLLQGTHLHQLGRNVNLEPMSIWHQCQLGRNVNRNTLYSKRMSSPHVRELFHSLSCCPCPWTVGQKSGRPDSLNLQLSSLFFFLSSISFLYLFSLSLSLISSLYLFISLLHTIYVFANGFVCFTVQNRQPNDF